MDVLEEMIKIPEVQARLKATGNKLEVMLGYSDSSKAVSYTHLDVYKRQPYISILHTLNSRYVSNTKALIMPGNG